MLGVVLVYLAYAAAAGAAVGAIGYVAAGRFSLVQRLLATLMSRTLDRIADSEQATYSVTHTDTGIVATGIAVGQHVLQHTEFGGTRASAASIQRLELRMPSLSRPLALQAHGVRLALHQVQLPTPVTPEARAAQQEAAQLADKAARLAAVEELLWGSPQGGQRQPSRWNPASGLLSRLQARVLQRMLAVGLQYVQVEVADVEVQYCQYGEPGPRPAASYLQGADAARLRIRGLTLLPQGSAVEGSRRGGGGTAASRAQAGGGPEATTPSVSSLHTPPPPSEGGVAAAAAAPDVAAAAAAAAEDQLSWRQALLQLPHLLWAGVATDRPSSTRLTISGVSLSLITFPTTWRGFHAASAAVAAAAAAQAAAAAGPFAFAPGRSPGVAQQRERPSPGKRRRARVTAERVGPPPLQPARQQQAQDVQQLPPPSQQDGGGGASAGCWARLAGAPAEEHILFRQWEACVTLCLLPPGSAATPRAAAAGAAAAERAAAAAAPPPPAGPATPGSSVPPAADGPAAPPPLGFGGPALSGGSGDANGGLAYRQNSSLSLGEAQYDSDLEDESPRSPHRGGAAFGSPPQGANGHAPPGGSPPPLDRTSMVLTEEHTIVTPAERLAWRAATAGGGAGPRHERSASGGARHRALPSISEDWQHAGAAAAAASAAAAAAAQHPQDEHQPPPQRHPAEAAVATTDRTAATVAAGRQAAATAADLASDAAGGGGGAASGGPGSLLLDVVVSLKALVPELNAASLAIATRLVDRQLHHQHFGQHWAARPQVPVQGHAAAWWQHAGWALAGECRRAARREVALAGLEARRAARLEYQGLYAAAHAAQPSFREPGRRWWQRRRVRPAAAGQLQRLAELEEGLSAEEVAHFRFGVAAVHNARLAGCPALCQFVADKLDTLVLNRLPPSPALLQQLLHLDQPPPAAPAGLARRSAARGNVGEADGGNASAAEGEAGARAPGAALGVRITATCPKLGVALSIQSPAAAPEREPCDGRPAYVQLTLHSLELDVSTAGALVVSVSQLAAGPCSSPLSRVHPHHKVLSAPSSVCRRLCKAADFFQYAVHGTVAEEALSSQLPDAFLTVTLRPRPGLGGLTVDSPPEAAAGWQPCQWRPGGSDTTVQLAAVALTYHTSSFAALLHLADCVEACRLAPWAWHTPIVAPPRPTASAARPAAAPPPVPGPPARAGGARPAAPPVPPLPPSPVPVSELVVQSFGAHGVPMLGLLRLEGNTLTLHCPGLAAQLPYSHNSYSDVVRMGGAAASQPPATAVAPARAASMPLPSDPAAAAEPATAVAVAQATAAKAAAAAEEDDEGEGKPLRYALTLALQNINLTVAGEDACGCLRGGVARRIDATAYIDVFSYLSPETRHAVAARLSPARVTFDAARRTHAEELQELDSLESLLREVEVASMAKVWAYPDDLAPILAGIRGQEAHQNSRLALLARLQGAPQRPRPQRRPSTSGGEGLLAGGWAGSAGSAAQGLGGGGTAPGGGAGGRGGLAAGLPPEFLQDPSKYPMPLIPYLKCGILRGHVLQPLSAMPAEPGGAELASAVSTMGLQAWLSPLHVWHLLSVEKAVRTMFEKLEKGRVVLGGVDECYAAAAPAPTPTPAPQAPRHALVRPRSPKLLLSFGVAQVSLLWLIGTWTPKSSSTRGGGGAPPVSYRRAWGISVKRDDDAYVWARWLAPVYSVTVANVKAALRMQSDGCLSAGASVDGIIVRDLQLPETARHAYVLRPLPARARRLNAWHIVLRRAHLGIQPVSHARKLWARACQTIFLRSRTSAIKHSQLGQASPLDAVVAVPLSLVGPQASLRFASSPATPLRPAAADLWVEVGQMLAYVRIKQQASMTAFATQLTQITDALAPPAGDGEGVAPTPPAPSRACTPEPPSPKALPRLQKALRVTVCVVGIDVLFRVQSRDLMSIKLEQGRVVVDQRAVTRASGPRDVRLHLGASVADCVVRDLRARPEHSLVLIPAGGEEACSLEVAFTSYVDPRRAGPRLNVLVQNPRILLLMRFVDDVMGAVAIITSAAQKTEEAAADAAASAAAAGAPSAGAAAAAGVAASNAGSAAAAAADATVAPAVAAAAAPATAPLEVIVQLRNLGVVLPTSSASRSALGATVDHLLLALPGNIMPPSVLADCELPPVADMMDEAIKCTHEFKYSSFHDGEGGAARTPAAPPDPSAGEAARQEQAAVEAVRQQQQQAAEGRLQAMGKNIRSKVERVAEAAEAEAVGAAGGVVQGEKRQLEAHQRRLRKQKPAGVLFLNAGEAQQTPSGVLHINDGDVAPAELEAQARRDAEVGVPFGSAPDWRLGDIAEAVGRGVKDLLHGETTTHEVAVEMPSGAAGTQGRRGTGATSGDPSPARPLVVQDATATGLIPLVLDEGDSLPQQRENPLPDPQFIISIEAFTVIHGQMVRVPNFYYQKEHGPGYINPRQGSCIPSSLSSFSWPIEVWDLISGHPFIHPTSIALSLFSVPEGGASVPLLHLSATPLSAVFNAPNFTAIMDFVSGNLDEYLHPEKHGRGGAEAEPPPPAVPPEVHFNPNMKFGPLPGMLPFFRLTVATPRLSVAFEAHPREWRDPSPAYLYAGLGEVLELRPFMRGQASNVLFDLGCVDGGRTFMKVATTSLDVQDLRPAYRLQQFVRQSRRLVAQAEAEEAGEGMVTPPSHFSDSGHSTPRAADGERERSGVARAAAAGSEAAADSLAPPEVRQRVLSDAAAEMLLDELDEEQRAALVRGQSPAAAVAERGASWARAAESAQEGDGAAVDGGAALDDPLEPLYRAAQAATQRLHRQPSDALTLARPSPPSTLGTGGRGGGRAYGAEGEEGSTPGTLADTPATPSTGGFTFMLPDSRHGPPAVTPGLLSADSEGLAAGSGLPPGIAAEGHRAHGDPNPHTGIRLSVARRLSEQAERRRSMHTPSSAGASGGAQWARSPSPPAEGGGAGLAGGPHHPHHHHYGRVIELLQEPLLGGEEDVAVVRLLSAPTCLPPDEAIGVRPRRPPGSNPRLKLEVSLAIHADSTTAVEVALSEALVNWPYFQDLSLIWSLSNIFSAPTSPQRPRGERDDLAPPKPPAPPELATGPAGWLYFNLLVAQSQVFVPVYDVGEAAEWSRQLWSGPEGGQQKSGFEQVADMALAFAVLGEVDETDERLALEERGLALTTTALRFAYSYGGDGETNIKVDLRDTAAFVRDPGARVNCALLPFSCKVDVSTKVPRAAEQGEVERLHRAATLIQRCWRRHCARKAMAAGMAAGTGSAAAPDAAAVLAGLGRGRGPRRLDSMLAAVEGVEGVDAYGRPWQLVDELVMDVASPHTRKLIKDYKRQSQDRTQLMYLQRFRATSSTLLHVEAGELAVRAAFSHIPFWQAATRAVRQVVLAPAAAAPSSLATTPLGPEAGPECRFEAQLVAAAGGGAGAAPGAPRAAPFRPSSLQITLATQQATAVLCNDKPETFGAPDVLQCSLAGVSLAYDAASLLPDRPANKAGRLALKSFASFLNSSTSRWEALFDSWPLAAEFVDIVSPIYLSDRQTNVWLTSEQHLDLNFNPASLLSLGDALAFMRSAQEYSSTGEPLGLTPAGGSDQQLSAQDASFNSRSAPPLPAGSGPIPAAVAAAAAAGAPQPGLPPAAAAGSGRGVGTAAGSVMSRAPQKYLIQNQSGMRVYYWTDATRDGAPRSPVYCLDNGGSENLKVLPTDKRLSFVQFGSGAVGSDRLGATINLHFEGNWMPVVDVAVNVVGKYRYRMTSPADSTWVPLIIDIILVGRTKIITLHSGIWVENAIDRDISLRLHVPTTSLVPPPAGSLRTDSEGDVAIGPLKPQSGCYLPLTAVLGGRLFLRPDGFQEAARDVVRLRPDITFILSQQGFVSCEPELLGMEEAPLHVALQAQPAKLVSEFQAFKHMECVARGTIQRASSPLEVTLSVQPTLVLHNALPYEMRVLLWQHLPPNAPDAGLPPATATAADPLSPRLSPGPTGLGGRRTTNPATPGVREGGGGLPALFDLISPRGGGPSGPNRRGAMGRYSAHTLAPGGSESLYVDMRQVVQAHVSVEEVGMRSTRWCTLSQGVRFATLPDGRLELENKTKLPRDVPLRMVGLGMGLPTARDPASVDRYLAKLKDAALHMRLLHTQFHYDAKLAVSKGDIEAAWGRLRALGKRIGKASHNVVARRSGSSRTRRQRRGGGSPPPRRPRFPTIVERVRRAAVVELAPSRQQPASGGAAADGAPRRGTDGSAASGSTLGSEAALAAAEAADASLQVRQQSAGHLVVERAPRPHVTLLPPPAAAGAASPHREQGPTAASPGLALNPVYEDAGEGQAGPGSAASTPDPASPGRGGEGAVAASPAAVASSSQATGANLLPHPPPSTPRSGEVDGPAQTTAAGGAPRVSGGRVAKLRAGLSRFSRFLSWRRPGGSGSPAPAPRVAAAATSSPASAHPSPSVDSRASSRGMLLGERARLSDALRSSSGTEGVEAAAAPPSHSPAPRLRTTSGEDEATVGWEAVPEGSTAGSEQPWAAPGVEPALEIAPSPREGSASEAAETPRLQGGWWRRMARPSTAAAPAAASSPGAASEDGEEEPAQPDTPRRARLRATFDAWRTHCADAAWRRHGRECGQQPAPGSPRSEASEGDDVQVRSPPLLHLGLHNTLNDASVGAGGSCRVTLYAPYWLNNRTGVDLFYQDRASAPGQPFLFGAALPWDYGEVFTPGTSMTEASSPEASESPAVGGDAWDLVGGCGEGGGALLEYKLVLMNKQEEVMVGLAHVPARRYSPGTKITTVGNKASIELRGPVQTRPITAADVPMVVARGLHGALQAAAAGAGRAVGTSPARRAAAAAAEEVPALEPLHTSRSSVEPASSRSSPEMLQRRSGAVGDGGEAEPQGGAVQQALRQSPFDRQREPGGGDVAGSSTPLAPPPPGLPPIATGPSQAVQAGGSSGGLPAPPASGSGQGTPTALGAWGSRPRHLRRASMQDNSLVETMSTQPGTMLVRVTAAPAGGTPTARQLRRMGSSMSRDAPLGVSASREQAPAPEQEVEAAVAQMQQVPLPLDAAAKPAPAAEEEEEEVAAGGQGAGEAAGGEAAAADVAAGGMGTQHQLAASEAAAARRVAQASAAPALRASVPRGSSAISFRRGVGGMSSASHDFVMAAMEAVQQPPDAGEEAAGRVQAQTLTHPDDRTGQQHQQRRSAGQRPAGKLQKAYEFAVDVAAGPPDSIFRHTKLVSLKPKYMIENQTGLAMVMKQAGTQDPDTWAPDPARFARVLSPGNRAAVYWDDAELARELVVRPAPYGEEDSWHWSGCFPIRETEYYFGLRIRHKHQRSRYMNIPVNVTVGPYGSIQVTLKSPSSVPPYRIENACKEVQLYFIQLPLVSRPNSKRYIDNLPPGEMMPYAWDEPTQRNLIRVQAKVAGKASDSRIADYGLDHLGDAPLLMLPTHGGRAANAQRRLYRSLSSGLPEDLKQKLVSLLAAEFSKKVYVSVYADGPTRVLRFSDDKNVSSLEAQNVVLDLAARLRQVEAALRQVNAHFARLNGVGGAHTLDLYGRTTAARPAAAAAQPAAARKAGKRLPLREATRELIRQAHSKRPAGGDSTGGPASPARRDSLEGGSLPPSAAPSLPASRTPSFTVGARAAQGVLGLPGGALSRQATVRFDMGPAQQQGPPGVPRPASAAAAPPGVLRIPEQREERLLPYRRLMVRTGSEPGEPSSLAAADEGGQGSQRSPGFLLQRQASAGEIQEEAAGAPAAAEAPAEARRGGHTTLRMSASGRDWGHITPSTNQAAGTRRMAASASKVGMARSNSGLAGGDTMRRRQEMLRGISTGDAVLLLGGDLTVTVVQAQGLSGPSKSTHPFARVYISEPFPTAADDERGKQTSVVWQSSDPVWDEALLFRDVCAAAELAVELWDLGGTRSTAQLNRLAQNPSEVIKSCRFLGRAEVALADTLSMLSGVPAGTPLWLPLMRRDAGDAVAGQLQLRFVWEVTARSLLTIKLHALERVLAQRREILAALQPVAPEVVRGWAPPEPGSEAGEEERSAAAARGGVMAAGVNLFGVDSELGLSGVGWSIKPSRVATEVLARHAHDHNRRHLVVTVLEARGLQPRRGVVVALSASELPSPVVSLDLPHYPTYTTACLEHTLTPRWDGAQRHVFQRVDPAQAALTVRLLDSRGGFRRDTRLLGQASLHCSHVKGEDPAYVWVPLGKPRRRRDKAAPGEDEVSELQVHLRLQWQTEAVRGQSMKVEVDMAGLSLVVMGGLQDELFNLTTDEVRAAAVRTALELQVEGSVRKVQLDNQMLDAVQPVVLAPAVEYRPQGAITAATKEPPLVSFSFTRSFAGSAESRGSNCAAGQPPPASPSAASLGAASSAGEGDRQSIKSFKDLRLSIGALDLMTDEAFLEALLSFITSIPTADVAQDRPWRQQQRRLLAAQFGPREVESLAVNAIVPLPGEEVEGEGPLDWVVEKEARNLEVLHGQSDLSSWYFIERAEVGALALNVTVSLSSRLLSTAGRPGAAAATSAPAGHTGAFNRALGASGFTLVNVANVPIVLGRWMVGSDPAASTAAQGGRGQLVSNGFLSQKALVNNLARHYTREGLKEAHKVLGGAGPAVASVPLTVLWAGGSAFSLVRGITAGNTGPVIALQQLAYVPLMSFSMIASGFSRMLAALLAALPPGRAAGDDDTVQRLIKRPNSALEALARAPAELLYGIAAAAKGLVLDPVAGWQEGRRMGLAMGLAKGVVGVAVRPLVAAIEACSKLLYALALATLGREGILGKMQRRVKAPGAFAEDAAEFAEEGQRREAAVAQRALLGAWQRVLPEFFPQMADDTVEDVVNIRSTRVVLVTDRHVAYLRARHQRHHSMYKAKWLLPIAEIQNLSGDSETFKISITHVHRYSLWLMGVWPVQKRKGMRCGSRPVYERVVAKLSRLLQRGRGEGGEEEAVDAALSRYAGADYADLTILSGPYLPPHGGQGRAPLALPAPAASTPTSPHGAR